MIVEIKDRKCDKDRRQERREIVALIVEIKERKRVITIGGMRERE